MYIYSYVKIHQCHPLPLYKSSPCVGNLVLAPGPQNHEKWRFYTPNIWVMTPKNEGNVGSHGAFLKSSESPPFKESTHRMFMQARPVGSPPLRLRPGVIQKIQWHGETVIVWTQTPRGGLGSLGIFSSPNVRWRSGWGVLHHRNETRSVFRFHETIFSFGSRQDP